MVFNKRLLTTAAMASVIAITIPFSATTVEAHANCKAHRSKSRTTARRTTHKRTYRTAPATARYARGYSDSYEDGYASSRTAYINETRPGYYSRHRRLVNTGVGAAAGALVGGLLGGKRGAGIGILAGGAGSQIFTHYQRPRNYTRYRR